MGNPLGDLVAVTGAFASGDHLVINWGGENYYKSCGEPVVENEDGSGTSCVKREDHPGDIHEDFDGVRKTDVKGRIAIVVTQPLSENLVAAHKEYQGIMDILRPLFKDKTDVKIYGAVREQADQIVMILEGDG